MRKFEKPGWYSLELPEGWQIEQQKGEPDAFYDPQGAGVIHAAVQEPGPLKQGERIDVYLFMRAFLKGVGVPLVEKRARRFSRSGTEGAFYEFTSSGPEGKVFERLWFLTNHEFVLFLTYACPEGQQEVEREAVDRIVSGVRLLS